MLVNINNISYNLSDFTHVTFYLGEIVRLKDRIDKEHIPVYRTKEVNKYTCLHARACLLLEIQKMMRKKQVEVEIRG
jgi:hypothetical protein